MAYHYYFSFGAFNIKNVKNRKNLIFPASFLILGDDEAEDAGCLSSSICEEVLRKLLIQDESLLHIIQCDDPAYIRVYQMEYHTPHPSEDPLSKKLDPYTLNGALMNMVIDVWDPIEGSNYYMLSTDRLWNLSALEFTFFPSNYYEHRYRDRLLRALDGYLLEIFSEIPVVKYSKYHADEDIKWREKFRVGKFETTCAFSIDFLSVPNVDDSLLEDEPTVSPLSIWEKRLVSQMLAVLFGEEGARRALLLGNEYTRIDLLQSRIENLSYEEGGRDGYLLMDAFSTMNCPALSSIPLVLITPDETTSVGSSIYSRSFGETHSFVYPKECGGESQFDSECCGQLDIRNIWHCFHKPY